MNVFKGETGPGVGYSTGRSSEDAVPGHKLEYFEYEQVLMIL